MNYDNDVLIDALVDEIIESLNIEIDEDNAFEDDNLLDLDFDEIG